MRIITYFTFTLLSILIQFSLMDYIQERMQFSDNPIGFNATSQKKQLKDILKDITNKPHAIYYRSPGSKLIKNNISIDIKSSTLAELPLVMTEISTTVYDVLYDENTSITETSFTTEAQFTTTEFDNVTEISLFEKDNQTTKPNVAPKRTFNTHCYCNLLYKVCDINCCCDAECSKNEIQMFLNCPTNKNINNRQNKDGCYSHVTIPYTESYVANNLFCIVKTNLPDKRNLNQQFDKGVTDRSLKWKGNYKIKKVHVFTNKMYKYGDPIWTLENGSTSYMDLPSSMINSYCTGRTPIQFLREEIIKCNVKLRDVEMIQIMKKAEEATVISATPLSMNSSESNCSTLHCVNWTIVFCDNDSCMHYNKKLHEPSCTETMCTNLALKMDYIFYYYDSKITNATVKFYVQNTSIIVPFMSQEINVKFLMGNDSIDHIVKFSGSPGYRNGLPVIVSFAEKNHTENFYKSTNKTHLSFPDNRNGLCVSSNITENILQFGLNKRTTCKYYHKNVPQNNNAGICKIIQNDLIKLLKLNDSVSVSPYGNPQDAKDEDWIVVKLETFNKEVVYEEYSSNKLELNCFNLITSVSLTFGIANMNGNVEEYKILTANCEVTRRNVSFKIDELSMLLTVDIIFIDVIKRSVSEYAGGPHLDIRLPKDFFFPFPSNESYLPKYKMYNLIICCVTLLICK